MNNPKFEICKTYHGGNSFEGEIDGVKIFMHHYQRIAELVAKSGEFDLCIFGHTHKFYEEKIGETLLLNPSSVHPHKTEAGFVIFDTNSRSIKRILL